VKALLLAAGLGTRLRPLTDTLPKCLAPVLGKPLLAYWLDMLLQGGVERVLINTHHLADQVEAFVRASPWRDRVDTVYESALLGTAGTLRASRDWLGDGPCLLAHADNLTLFDVEAFRVAYLNRPKDCVLTMMTFATDSPRSCGIVETDEAGRVVGFHEKVANPPGNQANAAVYLLGSEVMELIDHAGPDPLDLSTQVIPKLLGRINTLTNSVYHRDIGTLESLATAQRDFAAAMAHWHRAKGAS
jgi:mannose-1-phosphate guanylyltransferase